MRINEKGLELIKSFEGCKLHAYKDIVGITTIGYGHTGSDVYMGMVITYQKADYLLMCDLKRFENGVDSYLAVKVTPNQFSALVCFAFNVGLGNLQKSTLLRKINANDPTACDEFLRWDKAGGKVVAGLTRRRKAERELFLS